MKPTSTQLIDELVHPVSRAIAQAMDEIHTDYDAVMAKRRDAKGNFDPLKLPDDRECLVSTGIY